MALCALSIANPISYSKGRVFEGRIVRPENYIQEHNILNAFPIIFIRTLAGGEPEILRVIACGGLLLIGVCVISLGFDFAPKSNSVKLAIAGIGKQEKAEIVPEMLSEQPVNTIQDASD